jgi:bacterial leucyl aminopeptidase
MTGYHKAGSREEIGVITDNVDPDLTDFLRKLIDEYAGLPWVDTACGYGCSDHAVRLNIIHATHSHPF